MASTSSTVIPLAVSFQFTKQIRKDKKEFDSCDCFDLSHVNDWGNEEIREQYNAERKSFCTDILGKTARKLVNLLTVDNPNVVRDA